LRIARADVVASDREPNARLSKLAQRRDSILQLQIAHGICYDRCIRLRSARDFLDTGGTWEVRGVFGTRTLVGLEGAYVGSAYGLDAPGGLTRTLYGHGLEGSLRLNFLRNGLAYAGGSAVGLQPYILGGFGWTHYHLSNNVSTASVENSDNTLQLPVGAGLSYYFNERVMLDARFTYRFAFSDNLINGSSLDTMGLTARIGAEF
jgi:opacity protein-like surface antigen